MINPEDIEEGDNVLFYDIDYGLVIAQVAEVEDGILQTFHEKQSDVFPIEIDPYEVLAIQTYDGRGEQIRGYDGEFHIFDQGGLEDALMDSVL